MRNKNGKIILKRSWEIGTRVTCAVLLVLVLLPLSGCTPDIKNDWTATVYGEMLFDTSVTPAVTPQPTSFALDPNTGLIVVSLLGIVVPTDCENLTADEIAAGMNVARCEFYQYLTSLDGFPTLPGAAVARAPVSKAVDLSKLIPASPTSPANTAIMSFPLDNPLAVTTYDVGNPTVSGVVAVSEPPMVTPPRPYTNLSLYFLNGWQPYTQYLIAFRGGPTLDDGLMTMDKNNVMESAAYNLLKRTDSLTCGTPIGPGDQVPVTCPYFTIVNGQEKGQTPAEVSYNLFQLETIRTQFIQPASILLSLFGKMSLSDAATFWPIQTHSNPVAEFLPQESADLLGKTLGDLLHTTAVPVNPIVPTVTEAKEIQIAVKSADGIGIDNRSLVPVPFITNYVNKSIGVPITPGSIVLIDAGCPTASGDIDATCGGVINPNDPRKIPLITARYSGGKILLDLIDTNVTQFNLNHVYVVLMSDFISDNSGRKMVPCPTAVFAKSSGPLVINGQSAIPEQLSLTQAQQAEAGRLQA